AANAKRAGFHLLPDELAHFIHLLRRGLLVFEADNVLANRGRADKGGDVAGHTPFFEILQILDECVPRDVILDVRLLLQHVLADAITANSYVGLAAFTSSAVVNGSVFNDDVEFFRQLGCWNSGNKKKRSAQESYHFLVVVGLKSRS